LFKKINENNLATIKDKVFINLPKVDALLVVEAVIDP
jgi:hypothetical protein